MQVQGRTCFTRSEHVYRAGCNGMMDTHFEEIVCCTFPINRLLSERIDLQNLGTSNRIKFQIS